MTQLGLSLIAPVPVGAPPNPVPGQVYVDAQGATWTFIGPQPWLWVRRGRGRGNGNGEPVMYPWDPLKPKFVPPTVKVDTKTGKVVVETKPAQDIQQRITAWLDEEMIAGVKNKWLALGAVGLWLWKRKA